MNGSSNNTWWKSSNGSSGRKSKITINNNGSIRVEGEFEIHDAEGKPFDYARFEIVLEDWPADELARARDATLL